MRTAHRNNWRRIDPLINPEPIPAPARIWTEDEMSVIRHGYIPWVMDEKWFIFLEQDRLFAHRSWTGLGVVSRTASWFQLAHQMGVHRAQTSQRVVHTESCQQARPREVKLICVQANIRQR